MTAAEREKEIGAAKVALRLDPSSRHGQRGKHHEAKQKSAQIGSDPAHAGFEIVILNPSGSVTVNPIGPQGRGPGPSFRVIPAVFACFASAAIS